MRKGARAWLAAGTAALTGLCPTAPAHAQDTPPAATPPAPDSRREPAPATIPETWAIHGQTTLTSQAVAAFPSPYAGANSLIPHRAAETFDATIFAGVAPWRGAELWVNGEVDQGFGLSNTLGVAGFTSGEAYKVGKATPYARIQRLFLRQTIDLGGASTTVAGTANVLAHVQRDDRLVLTLGKFAVVDVFDTNAYAHDPRADFLNWSVIDTGSLDYAADAWGYSVGGAAELYRGNWTARIGAFALSTVPNGEGLQKDFGQFELIGEVEHRHTLNGHPGAVRVTLFGNDGRFSRLDDALTLAAASGRAPDVALTRRRNVRLGAALNIEQEVTAALGLFARAGVSDGRFETYDFTDIDRTVALGGALKGTGWHRGDDVLGLALVVNGISAVRRRYLAAGGLGVLIGDGRLPHPGAEDIIEASYNARVIAGINVTLDNQVIANPGYNRDRGPANVTTLRLHAAF